jgi:predicted dehydrogenase
MTATATQRKLLRVLHVGVANRGEWPLRLCNASTGFAPSALCDVSDEALAKAREFTGLSESACFTDFDRALEESDVDCAIVCAPTVLHVPLAKKCVARGVPVLVEKGMAPDWNDACDLVRAARDASAVVAVAQNYRYNSMERTVWRAINDPEHPAYVGEVHVLTYAQHRVRPVPRTLTYPFASVWDMSCHHFDNMLHWLGPVREMTAHGWRASWSAYEHDNNTSAHVAFERGTRAHYVHTHDAARSSLEIQVHGGRGALVVRDDGGGITFNERPLEQFGTRPISDVEPEPASGEADLLRDFYRYVTQGIEPGISARNNLETMAACEMMVRSITLGRTVRRAELESTQP